ncbi:hypothetical protein Hsw_2529 [Hymenobacter swuensis DY53]|uniref:Uncharacterized protein n=1 Tax=Hymenobacter swuensis DY53 TaxID=1227739 RepID=W8EYE3_9BACT|nr:hypothetical protein Hsw_2529 [Hymenobacter swuensis DY53]
MPTHKKKARRNIRRAFFLWVGIRLVPSENRVERGPAGTVSCTGF